MLIFICLVCIRPLVYNAQKSFKWELLSIVLHKTSHIQNFFNFFDLQHKRLQWVSEIQTMYSGFQTLENGKSHMSKIQTLG